LSHFREQSSLKTIVSAMKSKEHFWDMFYQLAMAYRFSIFSKHTEIEPGENMADFYSTFGDVTMIGECSVVHPKTSYSKVRDSFHELATICQERAKKDRLSFLMIPKKIDYLDDIAGIKTLLRKINKTYEDEMIKIEVFENELIKDALNSDSINDLPGDIGFKFATTTASNKEDIETYDLENDKPYGFFAIDLGDIEKEHLVDMADKIDKKIQGKLLQLSKHPKDQPIYLFVELDYDVDNLNKERIAKRTLNNFFKTKKWLSGVWITQRRYTTAGRYQYAGILLSNPYNDEQFIKKYFDHINEFEGKNNFFIPFFLKKVGRNDPCPCKSGGKFKKCCGR